MQDDASSRRSRGVDAGGLSLPCIKKRPHLVGGSVALHRNRVRGKHVPQAQLAGRALTLHRGVPRVGGVRQQESLQLVVEGRARRERPDRGVARLFDHPVVELFDYTHGGAGLDSQRGVRRWLQAALEQRALGGWVGGIEAGVEDGVAEIKLIAPVDSGAVHRGHPPDEHDLRKRGGVCAHARV